MARSADKLLEEMRRTKTGWNQKHFEILFLGFGFEKTGKKHDIYIHTKFPNIRGSVPRHNKLKEWVASEAVKAIDALMLEQSKGDS